MAAEHASDPFLVDAAIFLTAAVVSVPLFKQLNLGSVLGYLVAGVIIGPSGLALISDAEGVLHIAEFGVVLLLFIIGLELHPNRLWRMRVEIFGLGFAQLVLTAGAIFGLLMAFGPPLGLSENAAILTGFALALSSTAFAVQILRDRDDLAKPYGQRSFSILLFQDLAVVPLLALASLLAPGMKAVSADEIWTQAGIAGAAVIALVVVGRYAMRPLFHLIALTKANEIFTAAALLVVVGAALAMQAAGLSMALGAFLAGLLLSGSEFRHQLESDIEPFRGLFLGLFFISVGMLVDGAVVLQNVVVILIGSVMLILVKCLILFMITRLTRSSQADALRIGATLGQGGEFAFVLLSVAAVSGLMETQVVTVIAAIVTLTMAATPLLIMLADRSIGDEQDSAEGLDSVLKAGPSEIIVAGFGRAGQVVARLLRMRGYKPILIDNSPRRIRIAQTFGSKVFFGDARRTDVLAAAGADRAKIIFLCTDDRQGAPQTVLRIKERFPQAFVAATAYDRFSEVEIRKAGADFVIRSTFESALALAIEGLKILKDDKQLDETVEEFRRRDVEMLKLQSEFGAHEAAQKMREKYSLDDTGVAVAGGSERKSAQKPEARADESGSLPPGAAPPRMAGTTDDPAPEPEAAPEPEPAGGAPRPDPA